MVQQRFNRIFLFCFAYALKYVFLVNILFLFERQRLWTSILRWAFQFSAISTMLYGSVIYTKNSIEVNIFFRAFRCLCVLYMFRWLKYRIWDVCLSGFRFHNGPKPLSQLMKESMASDPVAPVLWQPHLMALDRRVSIILTALRHCIETHSIHDVVYAHDLQWADILLQICLFFLFFFLFKQVQFIHCSM